MRASLVNGCQGKPRYANKEEARQVWVRNGSKPNKQPYHCMWCGGGHIGNVAVRAKRRGWR